MNFYDMNTRIYESELKSIKKDIFLCVIMITVLLVSMAIIASNDVIKPIEYISLGADIVSLFYGLILTINLMRDYAETKKILTFYVGMDIFEPTTREKGK